MSSWSDELGRELREAPIPDHRPNHFERIRARVHELEAKTAPAPPTVDLRRTRAAPPKHQRARPRYRLAAFSALVAAIVAGVAFTWAGFPGVQGAAPDTATADTVLENVEHALRGLDSISGDVVEYGSARGKPYARTTGSFVFTACGDYRIVQADRETEYMYDSRSRVARRYTLKNDEVVYGEIATGLPDPGPFFGPWMGTSTVLDRSVAAYARAVIADLDPDVPVTPLTYEGRTAWQITVAQSLVGGGDGGSARIIVDAESGYPLLVENWSPEGQISGTRLENVQVKAEADVETGQFSLRPEATARFVPLSESYRPLTMRQAIKLAARVPADAAALRSQRGHDIDASGFGPYVPTWVPRGYTLSGITGALNGTVRGRLAKAGHGNDIDSITIVLTYSRGFDRFCVVSRWRSSNPAGSDDPFDENAATLSSSREVAIQYGALRGAIGHVVIGLRDWPHIYTSTGEDRRVSVSVAGDLTRDELIILADSLSLAP